MILAMQMLTVSRNFRRILGSASEIKICGRVSPSLCQTVITGQEYIVDSSVCLMTRQTPNAFWVENVTSTTPNWLFGVSERLRDK